MARSESDRLTRSLAAAVFLQWVGASAILPMLPLYLRRHGSSDALVGAVMAAFFVAGVVSQYPAGRLGDRIGRRPVLLGGLLLYAVGSVAFLASPGPWVDVVLRGLQGAGAGAVQVAALAMVAHAVPPEQRGRASSRIYGSLIAGLAVGPLFGSIAGEAHMAVLFLGAGLASLVACGPVLRASVGQRPSRGGPDDHHHTPVWRRSPATIGALVATLPIGLATGIYETCWSLLLHYRHATNWEIGLSWTLFAVPFVATARPAGWLADHLDRRLLVTASLTAAVGLCALYPFLDNVPLMLALGTLEATFWAVAYPATQSLLTQDVAPAEMGAVQGLFATGETGSTALAAATGGVLFGLTPWLPFVATAVVAAAFLALLPVIWRVVPGRATARHEEVDPISSGDRPGSS